MDSTSNKNTTNNTNNNQESFSSFNNPFRSYDRLPTLNPITSMDAPSSSAQTHRPPPPPPPAARSSKKHTRASRRAPTTVLTTDATNFRSMVQQFTGFPTPPFPPHPSSSSPSSFPYCLPLRPMPSPLVDSIAAINAAINGNASLENVVNSHGSNTPAWASYPFVNQNTVIAPQFGDLGGPSGVFPGWDHQDDLNIRRELAEPPYKRQTIRGSEGAAIESWSASSSE